MREVKFRGKGLEDGEWKFGHFVTHDDVGYIVGFDEQGESVWSEVDVGTVGEFIERMDDEGNEIYDGDRILREGDSNKQWIVWDREEGGWSVATEWEDGEVDCLLYSDFLEVTTISKIRVVGTIYDEDYS